MEPENFRVRTTNPDDDAKYNFPSDLPLRPGVNSTGKAIQIRVNQYKVTQWPGRDIFQYDVSFAPHPHLQSFQTHIFADQHRKWR
jgi:eukaryotic translation initiation factor 2C